MDSKGQYAAALQNANPGPQPFLNFYARPVADAAAVDAIHAQISAVRDEHRIAGLTAPAREDPARFGVASYGFYVKDLDGNWWRVEDNQGPFGPVALPDGAEPRGSIVPAGPVSYVVLESRALPVSMRFYRDFLSATHQHGSYSFYLQDPDTNWWELEIWHDAISPVDRGLERTRPSG